MFEFDVALILRLKSFMKKIWLIFSPVFSLEYCAAQTIVQKDPEIEKMVKGFQKIR